MQCRHFKDDYHTDTQDVDGPGTRHSTSWERCPPGSESRSWGRAVLVCMARGPHGDDEGNDGTLAASGDSVVHKSPLYMTPFTLESPGWCWHPFWGGRSQGLDVRRNSESMGFMTVEEQRHMR